MNKRFTKRMEFPTEQPEVKVALQFVLPRGPDRRKLAWLLKWMDLCEGALKTFKQTEPCTSDWYVAGAAVMKLMAKFAEQNASYAKQIGDEECLGIKIDFDVDNVTDDYYERLFAATEEALSRAGASHRDRSVQYARLPSLPPGRRLRPDDIPRITVMRFLHADPTIQWPCKPPNPPWTRNCRRPPRTAEI